MRNFVRTVILTVALALASVVTAAAQGRTVDFTQQLTGLDGKAITLTSAPDSPPATLSDIAIMALTAQFNDEQTMPGSKKFELYELARKVYHGKAVVLTAEEVATLKDRIGRFWGPSVVGAAWPLLDPNAK